MQSRALSPAEIGTAMHTVMQHLPIENPQTSEEIEQLLGVLTERQLLTPQEASAVNVKAVTQFFETDIAKRLLKSTEVYRELPFTYAHDNDGDYQLLQGIADCLFKEEDGWVLLDYKTDRVQGRFTGEGEVEQEMQHRYGIQLRLYKRAIESIVNINIKEMVLYLFDGERIVHIQGEAEK